MDYTGKEMYHHSHIFCIGEWEPKGRVDATTEGSGGKDVYYLSLLWMPCHMYQASILTRTIEELLDVELSRWY